MAKKLVSMFIRCIELHRDGKYFESIPHVEYTGIWYIDKQLEVAPQQAYQKL